MFAKNKFDSYHIKKFDHIHNLKYLANRMKTVFDLGIELDRMVLANFPKGGLKPLAKSFGFNWTNNFDGAYVAYLFDQYQQTKNIPELGWENLLEYNKEDVFALRVVIENLNQMCNNHSKLS